MRCAKCGEFGLLRSEKRQRLRLLQNAGRRGARGAPPASGPASDGSRSEAVAANSENSAQTAPDTESGEESYPWEVEAEGLLGEFKPQVAAYIAWASSPAKGRKPATQAELASLLGLKNDRTIRQWRAKDKRIEATIKERQAGPLWAHRRDIFEALVRSASTPDAANFSDRKLALEMMGDYVPKSRLDTNNVTSATPFTSDEYSQAAAQLALWENQQAQETNKDDRLVDDRGADVVGGASE